MLRLLVPEWKSLESHYGSGSSSLRGDSVGLDVISGFFNRRPSMPAADEDYATFFGRIDSTLGVLAE